MCTASPAHWAITSHVQQTPAVSIDLVDKSEVFVAAAVGNFVDTDRFDRPNFPVNHAPADNPTDSTEDRVPAGSEDGRGFLPTEPLGPRGQEDAQAVGRLVFTVGPGNLLNLHSATGTIHASHRVNEKHRDRPERDEFKTPLRQAIVARAFLATATAHRATSPVRLDVDQDRLTILGEMDAVVHETLLLFKVIEDSFKLHLACCAGVGVMCGNTTNTRSTSKMHLLNKSWASCLRRSRPSVARPVRAQRVGDRWPVQTKSSGCLCCVLVQRELESILIVVIPSVETKWGST